MTTAREIMNKKVISMDVTVSALEVAKIMDKNRVSCVVLTKDDKPYGIVTERDLVTKIVSQNKRPAELGSKDIMTGPVTLVSPLTPIEQVAEKMSTNKVRHIVVADDEQPVGLITVTDFAKHLNTILAGTEGYNREFYDSLFEEWEYLSG